MTPYITTQGPQDRRESPRVDERLSHVDGRWIMRREHQAQRVSALWTWSMIGWGAGVLAVTYLPLWGSLAILISWTLLNLLAILGHLMQAEEDKKKR